MAIGKWHPGQLVVLWVGGVLLLLVIAVGLTEIPVDRWVRIPETNPHVIEWRRQNPGMVFLPAELTGYREPVWWGCALYRLGIVALFVIPTALLVVSWYWFGARPRK